MDDKLVKKYQKYGDSAYLRKNVPTPKLVGHSQWPEYLYQNFNQQGVRILEIGSREVTGKSVAREKFSNADYVGFDYYEGNNVDVVGDAHKLSQYFVENERFDLIYSSACFEHFAMPWIVSTEIAKLLKVGGTVFVETHFSFSSHERPWHFFQFSDMALKVLFSPHLGFECIDAGMSNPIVGRFSEHADKYLQNQPVAGLYCHSEFLGKKTSEPEHFDWAALDTNALVGGTTYPEPNK